jgi:hypothetical protein
MVAINTHPIRAFVTALAVALFVVAGTGAGLAFGTQDASQTADGAGFVGT